jgi:hypothetical protein
MRHVAKHWREGAENMDGDMTKPTTNSLPIEKREGETPGHALARASLDPLARHANLASAFAEQMFVKHQRPSIADNVAVLGDELAKAANGDLELASRILASQAVSLDAMFTEMARRSINNMGEYLNAAELYMRLALKAQAASRTTLEALAKLHQPREQTVRHVHVNDGGQAIVADQFHHHGGRQENGKSVKQSDATGATGERAALPCSDTCGDGVPIASGKRTAPLPYARRD